MIADYSETLLNHETCLAVVGMGYVGMPMALEFAKVVDVIGFDINENKIGLYCQGIDPTGEVGGEAIANTPITFTCNEHLLSKAKVVIFNNCSTHEK